MARRPFGQCSIALERIVDRCTRGRIRLDGGYEFVRYRDNQATSTFDITSAFEKMEQENRDNIHLTCARFHDSSPNIHTTGSSEWEARSLSHESKNDIELLRSITIHITTSKSGRRSARRAPGRCGISIQSHASVRGNLLKQPLPLRDPELFSGDAPVEILGRSPFDASNHAERGESSTFVLPDSSVGCEFESEIGMSRVRGMVGIRRAGAWRSYVGCAGDVCEHG
ncbi:hypothetical protein BD410DRAFT_179571 [Rickenella mellea]|uniref:Uncharacterized protein n=1 Tax=Rickenella mellea TaxID=50990 RepID=A0A4Y7PI13_9AGAM|nr:hypothetical protein BD410DRAFT_179571 [Rickenella mellea]